MFAVTRWIFATSYTFRLNSSALHTSHSLLLPPHLTLSHSAQLIIILLTLSPLCKKSYMRDQNIITLAPYYIYLSPKVGNGRTEFQVNPSKELEYIQEDFVHITWVHLHYWCTAVITKRSTIRAQQQLFSFKRKVDIIARRHALTLWTNKTGTCWCQYSITACVLKGWLLLLFWIPFPFALSHLCVYSIMDNPSSGDNNTSSPIPTHSSTSPGPPNIDMNNANTPPSTSPPPHHEKVQGDNDSGRPATPKENTDTQRSA